jgi:hypothetical protein
MPILVAGGIFAACAIRIASAAVLGESSESNHRRSQIINQHIWMSLLLSYLVLPPGENYSHAH